jgi:DNA-binding NtrC family response regulator
VKARKPARILVLDDQPKTADLLARLLPDVVLLDVDGRKHAASWREAEPFFASKSRVPDAVVLDLRFEIPDEDLLPDRRPLGDTAEAKRERRDRRDRQGLFLLERMRRLAPDLPVLLTTAHEDIPFEDEARRLNADAFTYTADEGAATGEGLARLVRRVLREREAPLTTGRFFWGKSAAMRDLRRRVAALAPTVAALVTGPRAPANFLVKEVLHPRAMGPVRGSSTARPCPSLLEPRSSAPCAGRTPEP